MSAAYPSQPCVAPGVDSLVLFVLLLVLFYPLLSSPAAKASSTLPLLAIAEAERAAGPDPSVGERGALMMVAAVAAAVVVVVGEVDDVEVEVEVEEHQQL